MYLSKKNIKKYNLIPYNTGWHHIHWNLIMKNTQVWLIRLMCVCHVVPVDWFELHGYVSHSAHDLFCSSYFLGGRLVTCSLNKIEKKDQDTGKPLNSSRLVVS